MSTEECKCLDCKPETLAFSEIIGKPETIEDLLKGLNMPMNLRFRLLTMQKEDYFIDRLTSDHIVFKRFNRDGHYWMRCDCGNIIDVPIGNHWSEYCAKCNPQELDSSVSRRGNIFLLLLILPIGIGGSWLLLSTLGIFPILEWPIIMIPLFLIMTPGLYMIIWYQIDQYRLKKRRKRLRKQIQDTA